MSTTLIPEHLELVRSLKQAIANKEKHQQQVYNCGTSCCIAGVDSPTSKERGRVNPKQIQKTPKDGRSKNNVQPIIDRASVRS